MLDAEGIPYDDTPGVSSFCGAAAALNAEYTLPTVSQTVIITRMEGRTPVPEGERLTTDGKFGTGTVAAVKRYQARHGLAADGTVGKATWEKLFPTA